MKAELRESLWLPLYCNDDGIGPFLQELCHTEQQPGGTLTTKDVNLTRPSMLVPIIICYSALQH